jgi:hypothetical protein
MSQHNYTMSQNTFSPLYDNFYINPLINNNIEKNRNIDARNYDCLLASQDNIYIVTDKYIAPYQTESSTKDSNVKRFENLLEEKSNFSEIIRVAKLKSSETEITKYIFRRIEHLNNVFEPEENVILSLGSLRGLLIFLYSLKKFRNPTITLNDSGYFQINWKIDKNNNLSLNFKENLLLNYVIFMPSRYNMPNRIILNGFMHVLDFKHYLSQLGIKLHTEGK